MYSQHPYMFLVPKQLSLPWYFLGYYFFFLDRLFFMKSDQMPTTPAAVDLVCPPTRQKHFQLFPPELPIDPNSAPHPPKPNSLGVHAKEGCCFGLWTSFSLNFMFLCYLGQAWKDWRENLLGTCRSRRVSCFLIGIQNPLSYRNGYFETVTKFHQNLWARRLCVFVITFFLYFYVVKCFLSSKAQTFTHTQKKVKAVAWKLQGRMVLHTLKPQIRPEKFNDPILQSHEGPSHLFAKSVL